MTASSYKITITQLSDETDNYGNRKKLREFMEVQLANVTVSDIIFAVQGLLTAERVNGMDQIPHQGDWVPLSDKGLSEYQARATKMAEAANPPLRQT